MTDKQPEALLDLEFVIEDRAGIQVLAWKGEDGCCPASNAEIALWQVANRLHAENERLQAHAWLRQKVCEDQEVRIDELRDERDRLREALLAMLDDDDHDEAKRKARAALAKETTPRVTDLEAECAALRRQLGERA